MVPLLAKARKLLRKEEKCALDAPRFGGYSFFHMRLTRTSITGSAAGTFFAASAIPDLDPHVSLLLKVLAAVAIALLGKVAADCPRACPGTDERGRPRPFSALMFAPLILAIVLAVLWPCLSGCVARNPAAGIGTPPAPTYVVSPQVAAWSNAVTEVATTAGTLTGTGPLIPTTTNAAFLLLAALSGLWARHKSAVADGLAAAVARSGPDTVRSVVAASCDDPKYAALVSALNAHLAAGQSPVCPPPPPAPPAQPSAG